MVKENEQITQSYKLLLIWPTTSYPTKSYNTHTLIDYKTKMTEVLKLENASYEAFTEDTALEYIDSKSVLSDVALGIQEEEEELAESTYEGRVVHKPGQNHKPGERLNIESPRYDQTTYEGRVRHFMATTNPMNILATDEQLQRAREIVVSYKNGTEDKTLTEDQIWEAKELYDSAFHPQTGDQIFFMGRMAFQVPRNMVIIGGMMAFYKTIPAIVFWQFANQSFNAITNFSNRNASAGVSDTQLATAFTAATAASVGTALFFNSVVKNSTYLKGGILVRFVPMLAVAAAHCVNIPLMRQQELKKGITVSCEYGNEVGHSSTAAKFAISQVIVSRIGMVAPSMLLLPLLMTRLERTATFIRHPWLKAPVTMALTGLFLTASTPMCCALFPQVPTISIANLEPHLQENIRRKFPGQTKFYYYKGL